MCIFTHMYYFSNDQDDMLKLENTEGSINNRQSRETLGTQEFRQWQTKQKTQHNMRLNHNMYMQKKNHKE